MVNWKEFGRKQLWPNREVLMITAGWNWNGIMPMASFGISGGIIIVSIATHYWLDGRGSIPGRGKRFFSFP
jgi:hypothetical protein